MLTTCCAPAIRAAVETARYQLHQACLRRLPAPPFAGRLAEMGGESPEGDLADVARQFIGRAELRVARTSQCVTLFCETQ